MEEYYNELIKKDAEIEHLKYKLDVLQKEYLQGPTGTEQYFVYEKLHNNIKNTLKRKEQTKQKYNKKVTKELSKTKDYQLYQKIQNKLNTSPKHILELEFRKQFINDPTNDKICYDLATYYLETIYKE